MWRIEGMETIDIERYGRKEGERIAFFFGRRGIVE